MVLKIITKNKKIKYIHTTAYNVKPQSSLTTY